MVSLGVVVAWALAAADAQAAPQAEVQLEPGTEVRAETDAGPVQGHVQPGAPGVLRLELEDGEVRDVPLTDVRTLQERRSGVPSGALWGAASLGWAGGAMGTFFGIVANGLRETGGATPMPVFTSVGALIGTGLGAGAGALVGLAFDRWPSLQPRAYGADRSEPRVRRDRVELGLGLGMLYDPEERGRSMTGTRARLHLLIPVGEQLAMGVEASLGQLDHFNRGASSIGSNGELDEDLTHSHLDAGVRGRYWMGPEGGSLRPLLSAGLALQALHEDFEPVPGQSLESRESFGPALSFGGGVDWVPLPGAPGFTFEALWRQGLIPDGPRASHLELSLTSALRF